MPQVVREIYEGGKTKLLDKLIYGDKELKAEYIKAEFGILIEKGKTEELLKKAEEMIKLDGKDAVAWFNKGLALGILERHEEALEAFSKSTELDPENAVAWHSKGGVHLVISLQDFKRNNYGNALENLNSAIDAFDAFSTFSKGEEKAKEVINKDLTLFLKDLIDAKNVEAVDMALLALFKKKEELKELFEPIYIAVEIVKSGDVNKYYELQIERREIVADIVKRLTGSEELLPQ